MIVFHNMHMIKFFSKYIYLHIIIRIIIRIYNNQFLAEKRTNCAIKSHIVSNYFFSFCKLKPENISPGE